MKLFLVYCEEDVEKNREYIGFYERECGERGHEFALKLFENFEEWCTEPVDVVVNRSRKSEVSAYYELHGVLVRNSSYVTQLGNNKRLAVEAVAQIGEILYPPFYEPNKVLFPVVAKTLNGHGGSEVFLIDNQKDLDDVIAKYPGNLLVQDALKDLGKDLRVYVVGGEIIAAIMRESKDDFRANFSLGATVSVHELTKTEREYANRIIEALPGAGFIGIDFIYDEGRPFFNEIEDAVGSRMLYSLTDIDPVKLYMDYLEKEFEAYNLCV